MSKKINSTALTDTVQLPIASFAALKAPKEVAEVMQANLGGEAITPFQLERIRVGTGGATAFQVTDEEGIPNILESFRGVICWHRNERNWWAKDLGESGGGSPPDCHSSDMRTGHGDIGDALPSRLCADCPKGEWGSDRRGGKGKDCKDIKLMFLLREGREDFILPSLLVAPASSLGNIQRYFTALVSRQLPYYRAVHKFALEPDKNASGIAYSKIRVTFERRLEQQEADAIKAYASGLREVFATIAIRDEA